MSDVGVVVTVLRVLALRRAPLHLLAQTVITMMTAPLMPRQPRLTLLLQ